MLAVRASGGTEPIRAHAAGAACRSRSSTCDLSPERRRAPTPPLQAGPSMESEGLEEYVEDRLGFHRSPRRLDEHAALELVLVAVRVDPPVLRVVGEQRFDPDLGQSQQLFGF